MLRQPSGTNLVEFLAEQGDDFGIFVAHVDEAALDPDNMRRDENAFNHSVRVS